MQQDSSYTIRRLFHEDVEIYKAMRLEALQLEAGVFGSSYSRENVFTNEQWLSRLTGQNTAFFGLFYQQELIGITGIVIDWDDKELAHMVQSYIRKAHRGRGLSRLYYDARLQWARNYPGLKIVRTGHRESNITSKAANQHYDFKFAYRESTDWPDGTTEDVLYYDLKLKDKFISK
jgi:RimJ/RimL family protein N-acetyltransferase